MNNARNSYANAVGFGAKLITTCCSFGNRDTNPGSLVGSASTTLRASPCAGMRCGHCCTAAVCRTCGTTVRRTNVDRTRVRTRLRRVFIPIFSRGKRRTVIGSGLGGSDFPVCHFGGFSARSLGCCCVRHNSSITGYGVRFGLSALPARGLAISGTISCRVLGPASSSGVFCAATRGRDFEVVSSGAGIPLSNSVKCMCPIAASANLTTKAIATSEGKVFRVSTKRQIAIGSVGR